MPGIAETDAHAMAAAGGRVVIVTGMSGAGKTSALKLLEDMGYDAVDNLPLSLLAGFVRPQQGFGRPLAIGVDVRTRDFEVQPLLEAVDRLEAEADVDVSLLFLDCDDETLRRRFTTTRRPHPLALDRPITDGIARERDALAPLKERADMVIDTTDYRLADLRQDIETHFTAVVGPGLAVFVVSFSYRYGLPRGADLVFDVRFLGNPHYEPELRPLTGLDEPVARHIAGDPDFESFFSGLTSMLRPLLPRFDAEGKSYLTIAIGCTGGRHRSVFVAEELASWLAHEGHQVSCHHRDIGWPPA